VSPAATFRTISKYEPCFLIDEFDAFMAQNEEFRGILNCCHTKGLKIIRCAPETHEPEAFYVFCPVAIATIGTLPDTVADRTIAIRLGRKQSARKTVPVRKAPIEPFIVLRRKIRRWVLDNAAVINTAEFLLPDLSNDRALENWETMAQIATVLGGPWPLRAFTAAKTLTPSDNDQQSFTIQLLVSLRRLFQGVGLDHPPHETMILATDKIVAALNLEKQAPWADKKEFFNGLTGEETGV
jgi:putative DNA primase/helicase